MNFDSVPLLKLHSFGGQAVLPTTCAMARMVMSAENELSHPFAVENYVLYKGVTFNSRDSQLTLFVEKPSLVQQTENPEENLKEVKVYSLSGEGKKVFHYGASINTEPEMLQQTLDVSSLQSGRSAIAQGVYTGALFHEGVLQGIKEIIKYDEDGIVVKCHCPSSEMAQVLGEFNTSVSNPVLDDLVLQVLILWPRLMQGISALPSRFDKWLYAQAIPLDADFYISLEVENVSAFKLRANLIVHDQQGRIFSEIRGAEATLSKQLNELFTQKIS